MVASGDVELFGQEVAKRRAASSQAGVCLWLELVVIIFGHGEISGHFVIFSFRPKEAACLVISLGDG